MLDDEKGPAELKRSSTSLVTTSAALASQKASRLKSMRIVRYENVMHIVSGVYDAKAGDQDAFERCGSIFPQALLAARLKYAPLRSSPSLSHTGSMPTAAVSDFSF